jgi:predicted PurR-regulated permease PerM
MASMPAGAPTPRSAGIVVLATLAVVAALYLGRVLLVPIALAILFTALLRPLVRQFERAGLSAPIGATIVLLVFVSALGVGTLALAEPVREWMSQAPKTLAAAEQHVRSLRRSIQSLTAAAEKLEHVADAGAPAERAAPVAPAPPPPPQSSSNVPGLAAKVFGTTTSLIGGLVEVGLMTLLLLASGDVFLNKLVKVLPMSQDKREAMRIASETEGIVSHYMVVTALINAGQGAVVGIAMWLLHVPNPVLWAILTFFLEFIPFLGGACMIILLTLVGLATQPGIGRALLPPAVYLTITTLQNNLVSPVAYGRSLRLHPVAVLVGVLFWYYLWGVPGAFLAVPILATIKVLGEHVERLAPVSEFLAD